MLAVFPGELVFPFALRLCHVLWGGSVGEELASSPAPIPCSHIGMEANSVKPECEAGPFNRT